MSLPVVSTCLTILWPRLDRHKTFSLSPTRVMLLTTLRARLLCRAKLQCVVLNLWTMLINVPMVKEQRR